MPNKAVEFTNRCLLQALSTNLTSQTNGSDSPAAIATFLNSVVSEILADICDPSDCNGNGVCTNGTCQCKKWFVSDNIIAFNRLIQACTSHTTMTRFCFMVIQFVEIKSVLDLSVGCGLTPSLVPLNPHVCIDPSEKWCKIKTPSTL